MMTNKPIDISSNLEERIFELIRQGYGERGIFLKTRATLLQIRRAFERIPLDTLPTGTPPVALDDEG